MFPIIGSETKSDKTLDKTERNTAQVNIGEVPSKMHSYSKRQTYAITIVIVTCILVAGVFGSIFLYGKYAKKETVIIYRTFEDEGVKHSIEITTKDADLVETVVFEKIDNVTDGGTLMFDFNQKLVAAYSDKDDACYLWLDESLDWDDRDWLFSGKSPSFFFTKEDEIPAEFLRRVVVDEIADKCFGVKTYWAILTAEGSSYVSTDIDGDSSRHRRFSITISCSCRWSSCSCTITFAL